MRARGFTLLEALVALGLAGLMIGVVALATQRFSRTSQATLRRIEERQALQPALAALRRDASLAVALPDLSGFFAATRQEQPGPEGALARTDALELTLLAGQPPRLRRARWSVGWDPAAGSGWLWREELPVSAAELPPELGHLASTEPPVQEQLLAGVTRFALATGDREAALRDPPAVGEPPLADGLVLAGLASRLEHDTLLVSPGALESLAPGALVWLRHERTDGPPSFRPGWYPFLRAEGERVVLARRVAWAEQVAYRAARLPARVAFELAVEGANERAVLALGAGAAPLLDEAARLDRLGLGAGEPP